LLQAISRLPDIKRSVLMRQVEDRELRADPGSDAFHRRDASILGAKIGLKDQRMVGSRNCNA
jgi:hypothetical protein